jgi:type I restriction enzyme S subunit
MKNGTRYKPYPHYNQSGFEWPDQVPDGWAVRRIKFCVDEIDTGGTPETGREQFWTDDEDGIPWVAIGDMTGTTVLRQTAKRLTAEGVASKKLRIFSQGTLLYSIFASLGTITTLGTAATVNQAILAIAPRSSCLDQKYLCWWLEALRPRLLMLASSSTQANLNTEKVRNLPVANPQQSEQRAIAEFLDRETAKIDGLIARKERLIKLLEEKRAALITHAVTRGLNPDASLRDSGIGWLGQVPRHWDFLKAKHICTAIVDCKNRTPEYIEGGDYYVVRTTDVKNGQLLFSQCLRTDLTNFKEWTRRGAPRKGDVLFTREAPAGEAAIFDGATDVCLGQRMMYFRTDPKTLDSRFLLFYIYGDAAKGYISCASGGSTVTHLRLGQVYDFPVIYPPIEEQRAIADYLEGEIEQFDRITAEVIVGIGKLQEYRAALITAAVTGKIDVRDEVKAAA